MSDNKTVTPPRPPVSTPFKKYESFEPKPPQHKPSGPPPKPPTTTKKKG